MDGALNAIKYTSIRFSGAYTDAIYTDFKNKPNAVEDNFTGAPAYVDATGKTLPGAAKFTANISPEFRYPVNYFGRNEFHTSFTETFTSKYNSDANLSDYGNIRAHVNTDFAIGIGRKDGLFDASFIAKNLFDNQTHVAQPWNTYQPAFARWVGVQFSGKF